MIAVIAGATGLVGTYLAKRLINDKKFTKVICVGRRASGLKDNKVQDIILGDLSEIKNAAHILKGDYYFCTLGTTIKSAGSKENFKKIDYQAIVDFAQIAKSHNAKCFSVISATGAKRTSTIFYNKVKGETEEELKELKLSRLLIFRPALLIGNRKEFRFAESMAIKMSKVISVFLPSKATKKFATQAKELAEVMHELGSLDEEGTFIINAQDI